MTKLTDEQIVTVSAQLAGAVITNAKQDYSENVTPVVGLFNAIRRLLTYQRETTN